MESPCGQSRRPVSAKTCPTSSPDRESQVGKNKPPLSARTRSAQTQDRKQELNSKDNMKILKDYCKEQTEKHAHALHQPHNTVDLQDVGKDLLERELEESKAKLEMYKGKNENLTQEITQLRSENKSLNEDIQRLKELEESNGEGNEYEEKTEHLTKKNLELLGTINSLTEEKERLIEDYKCVTEEKQSLIEENERLIDEAKMNAELKQSFLNIERERSTKEVGKLRKQLTEKHEKKTARLLEDIDRVNAEKNKLPKSEREQSKEEWENLRKDLIKIHEKERAQLLETIDRLNVEKDNLLTREREQSTKELENLRKVLTKSHEKERAQLLENIDRLNVEKDNLLKREREQSTKELENLRKDLTKSHEKERAQLLQNIDRLNVEKDNLLKRLSTIASDRLTHENPNIADLSDENRPTKLQEVYGELYDNEWTDAFEELKKHMNISDKDAIVILLKLLMNSFHNCREITWSRYEKLVNVASSIYIEKKTPIPCTEKKRSEEEAKSANAYNDGNTDEKKEDNIEKEGPKHNENEASIDQREVPKHNETSVDQRNRDEKMESRTEKIDMTSAKGVQSSKDKAKCTIELNVGILHSIKDIWKTTSFELKGISAESIYSVVTTNMDIPLESMPNTSKYMKSCIDLCWRMSVQERPLHLEAMDEIDVKAGKKFDKDKFRHFTKSGENIDFVVWPALYRYEGGPLILKGIAQGC